MTQTSISSSVVHKIALLADIPVTPDEEENLSRAFNETLEVVVHMSELDTRDIEPTHQVTGLENIWREDIVDDKHMFTQAQALANAKAQHQGYFVVKQVIDKD